MLKGTFIILVFSVFLIANSRAQCTTLGQNPSTAFPVCGTSSFQQLTVPICSSSSLYVPGCPDALASGGYQNKNPFWYKFTCFASGTLSFTITPNNIGDDYDWQLYDITGLDPNEAYTNQSIIVTGNWSGSTGLTGASSSGVSYIQCASAPAENKPTFAKSPDIIVGHQYLLLVSHFDNTQSGYSLSFSGGTASITDPLEPHLQSSRAICDGTQAVIKMNKRMKCNSLSADGSEFTISPAVANVINAVGYGCSTGFDMDSVILTLNHSLPPGNYTISIKNGSSDGNTLKDNCDREIPVGENIPMIVYPQFPTPMDSLDKVFCAPDEVVVNFSTQIRYIRCNSIAADGSDFKVTMLSGTSPVNVIGATGVCDANGLTPVIKVKFSAPIQTKGVYQIQLKTGIDGNTIINECGQETPAGATLSFATKDTVNADFTYSLNLGCKRDTINYFHDGRNEVNVWKWNFDNIRTSGLQNPSIVYASFGQKTAQLIVSNGVCKDTSSIKTILLDNDLKAAFEATAVVCPGDTAGFKDNSIGKIVQWNWLFGNGNTSSLQQPPAQTYPYTNVIRDIPVKLIVTNNIGCSDTATQIVKVVGNCYIAVPNAFTPNGDGLNDYLYPLNAYKAKDLIFRVYNRFGQLLFSTGNWTIKWDGSFKGQGVDPGTYVWILQYTNTDTGNRIEQKGTTVLIR